MANQYDTNLKLQAIADAIGNSGSSGLIQALEDIADAVAGGGGGGSSTAGLVSDNFSETDTYDLGDYCIHNNTLYVCINAITTPGAWDLSDWQATNAGIQLNSLNSAIVKRTDSGSFNIAANGHFYIEIPAAPTGYEVLSPVCRLGGSGVTGDGAYFFNDNSQFSVKNYGNTAHAWNYSLTVYYVRSNFANDANI